MRKFHGTKFFNAFLVAELSYQNANLAIIKFTWINFVLPYFSECSYQ